MLLCVFRLLCKLNNHVELENKSIKKPTNTTNAVMCKLKIGVYTQHLSVCPIYFNETDMWATQKSKSLARMCVLKMARNEKEG